MRKVSSIWSWELGSEKGITELSVLGNQVARSRAEGSGFRIPTVLR